MKKLLGLAVVVAALLPAAPTRGPLPVTIASSAKVIRDGSETHSSDGRLIALTVLNSARRAPIPGGNRFATTTGVEQVYENAEIWIQDVEARTTVKLEAGRSWYPVWSPDGTRLAFLSDRDGVARVWLWDRATGAIRRVSAEPVMAAAHYSTRLEWLPDNRRVLTKLVPAGFTWLQCLPSNHSSERAEPNGDPNQVTALVLTTAARAASPYHADAHRCDFAVIDSMTGEANRFARDLVSRWNQALSPDGRFLACELSEPKEGVGRATMALAVLSIEDGTEKFRISGEKDYPLQPEGWSPDGRYLACAVTLPGTGRVTRLLDTHTFALRRLDPALPEEALNLAWDGEGGAYVQRKTTLWHLTLDGSKPLVQGAWPEEAFRLVADSRSRLWRAQGDSRLLVQRHASAASDGSDYAWLEFTSGKLTPLASAGASIPGLRFVRSDGPAVLESRSDIAHHPELWSFNPATQKRTLLFADAEYADYSKGSGQLVTWTSRQGTTLEGALLLPRGYDPARRYPVILWVYGGETHPAFARQLLLQSALQSTGGGPVFDFHVLSTRGYAVFAPAIPLRVGTPMTDIADAVLPALDRLVELGIADPDRFAVMGHSYGGYSVASLLAQTDRFKAAVTSSQSPADLFSHSSYVSNEGTDASSWLYGQGRMPAPPWEDPQVFVKNSPLFRFGMNRTPLLLVASLKDEPNLAGINEIFIAYRRLGLEAEYVRYAGEDHTLQGYGNVVDFWNRRLAFLAKHLNLVLDPDGAIVFEGDRARRREPVKPSAPPPAAVAPKPTGLRWFNHLADARSLAPQANQRILVMFTGRAWCAPCQALEREVLATPQFAAFARDCLLVQLDFPPLRERAPERLAADPGLAQATAARNEFAVEVLPTLLLLDPSGRELARAVGYSAGTGPGRYLEHLATGTR